MNQPSLASKDIFFDKVIRGADDNSSPLRVLLDEGSDINWLYYFWADAYNLGRKDTIQHVNKLVENYEL